MANEELIERIDAIDPANAKTMRSYPPAFAWHPIPFYRKFQLLTATVRLPHRILEFHFADDGSRLCVLRATPEYLYAVNQLEGLQLEAAQIPEYLRFFFDNVVGDGIELVERPDEVRWFERADREPDLKKLKQQAESLIARPIEVTPLNGNGYRVVATAIVGRRLKEVDLVVARDGHVDVSNERVLIDVLPVVEIFP